MPAKIIDRGRGPELEGTRITVYRVMDYVQEGAPAKRIARELGLSDEQVEVALSYIATHREQVDQGYAEVLERVRQPNPAWVEAGMAISPEELKRRILERRSQDMAHADRRGQ